MNKLNNQSKPFVYFGKAILIIFLCTLISLPLQEMGIMDANIMMIYLVGILLIIIETKGYLWGMLSSVACVFFFNFFFAEPRFTLEVADINDILTFIIFLIISFIAGTLMSRLQKHADDAEFNEHQTRILYETSSGYLNVNGMDNILHYGVTSLSGIQDRKVVIYLAKNLTELNEPYYLPEEFPDVEIIEDKTAAQWCLSNLLPSGFGTSFFITSPWKYLPIRSKTKIMGVVGLYCIDTDISTHEMMFINAAISQLALAVEREQLYSQQEGIRMEIEKEHLRNNLLRAISHDLRTPLTGIAGSSSFMLESFDQLDKGTMLNLLSDISSDATWLNNLVENLLSMTRIQDGKLQIRKENEVVDDIVSETSSRVSKLLKGHELSIHIPNEVVTVPMDGRLIIQVLVNLVDNAINHTKTNSDIHINVYQENSSLVFEVKDNGGGIDNNILDNIFDNFVTTSANSSDSHRGIGLGLSICKAIIEAHNGTISAFNNQMGGATFRFTLPLK